MSQGLFSWGGSYFVLPDLLLDFRPPVSPPWLLSAWLFVLLADFTLLVVVLRPTVRPLLFVPAFMPLTVSFVPLIIAPPFLQVRGCSTF
jgi:hypothetical protein